ncbi:MAG: phenylalanine--tRNA ligase subunit beta, partial [Actinomycetales bacterium]|nr:phenylalanine--tRNA ligase subunit beta [Actinomycetales bacterium]
MRAPKSWISEYVDIPASTTDSQIADALVRVGFEVEEVIVQGADLTGPLVVGKVLAIEELKEHKKPIRYVELDCGEGQSRFVICGAQNFAVGDLIVASLPGAVLPGGFAISARETYGKTSNGMICSAKELGLGDDHSGIIVLPVASAKPGDDAIELLQINDTIFDVAVNPDRGYALSIRGIAREVAAALGLNFKDPAAIEIDFKESGTPVTAKISDGAQVMYLRTLQGFNPNAVSPIWMRRRIEKCGMRSISLAVDVTNYVMMELGQPLHAFDADKIEGGLEIRRAGDSKKLKTLDGIERNLNSDDLVVADAKSVLALAGTMGGEESEITDATTRIAVEAVRFDAISIAKNSRRHKLSSEAS